MKKTFDMEKWIIILSLLLLPVCGWWIMSLRQQLADGRNGLRLASRPQGLIERIGSLENQLDKMQKAGAEDSATWTNAPLYFQQQITKAARISGSDYTVDGRRPLPVTIAHGKVRGKVTDHEFEIKFVGGDRKTNPLTRKAINAIVVNSEAEGSRVWKLRELKIGNEQLRELRRKREEPPAEVSDNWLVERLVFVRREPAPQPPKAAAK